jgi:serine protease AprX
MPAAKLDLSAVTDVNAAVASEYNGQPTYGNGTSYAAPIMAGITTCLWQAFPEVKNSELIDIIHQASDKYSTPGNRTGYGIPDIKKAFVLLIKKQYSQQITVNENCVANLNWNVKTAAGMEIVVERKLPADTFYIPVDTQMVNSNFSNQHFSLLDDLKTVPVGSAVQYRVKMAIGTDTSFYLDSATITVYRDCNTVEDKVIMAPNPVIGDLKVTVSQNSQFTASIMLHSMTGQLVYKILNQPVDRVNTFIIPMKQLAKGVYNVTVFVDSKRKITRRILKQ